MAKVAHASLASEAEVPTDLLAGLLIEQASAPAETGTKAVGVPLKVYAVMAVTTLLTFATLTTGYQLLFSHQVFA
jgi:hypothetical protein